MRILIDSGTSNCRNLGDVAVLQAAVGRLRAFDRQVTIRVFTADATELRRHCPGVEAADELARREWIAAEFGSERKVHGAPGRPVDRIRALVRRVRRRHGPGGHTAADVAAQMDETDLYVVCGQATLADADRPHALCLLRTASLAHSRGIPVAFFSQGIGPLTDDGVLDLSRTILGASLVIGIREERVARPLLERLGVPASRVFLTGDDAVEAAYAARPAAPGNGLGIHLRIAPLAASSPGIIDRLRPVLQESARAHAAPMIPLPISHHRHGGAYDPATIGALLAGYEDGSDGGAATDTPARLTRSAGRCRIVVTGAYHAAVLALAQGIPAICLGESEYYLQKFRGLVDGFGSGCRIVRLDEPELWTRLREAIDGAWEEADALRRPLLEAAEEQIASARSAYAALRRQLDGPGAPTRSGGAGPHRAQRNAGADASPLTLAQGQRS